MKKKSEILFIDDEPCVLEGIERALHAQKTQWSLRFESCPQTAIRNFDDQAADVVISDFRMPGMDGFDIISAIKALNSDCEFMLLTGSAEFEIAIKAINQAGVFRFLRKPCDPVEIIDSIEQALMRLDARRRHISNSVVEQIQATSPGAVLELLATAIVVIEDQSHAVLYANHSAEALFQTNTCLHRDSQNRCRAASPELTARLYEAVSHALNTNERHGFLALPRPDGLRDLSAILLPLPIHHPGQALTVAMLINDPETDHQITPIGLTKLFGLTHAEANLAHALVKGETLQEAASACGITAESARTYLKRIFSKTDVSRQADLIKLILSTPAYHQIAG